jgi:hypothetical protein
VADLPPPRDFLLSEDALPEGWWAGSIEDTPTLKPVLQESVREAHRSYDGSPLGPEGNDWATQTIGVYGGEWSASEDFWRFVRARIDDERVRAAPRWAPLADWSYSSPIATEYRLAIFMEDWRQDPLVVVRVVARYDRYVTIFGLYADPDRISPEEIQQVLRGIDEAFASLYQ